MSALSWKWLRQRLRHKSPTDQVEADVPLSQVAEDLAGPTGLEPATSGVTGRCKNRK
jgi:hypothetical protein